MLHDENNDVNQLHRNQKYPLDMVLTSFLITFHFDTALSLYTNVIDCVLQRSGVVRRDYKEEPKRRGKEKA